MIRFNELRITPNGKTLIVDAQIEETKQFNDVSIKEIYIFNQDNYTTFCKDEKKFLYHKVTDDVLNEVLSKDTDTPVEDKMDGSTIYVNDGKPKRVRLELCPKDLLLDNSQLTTFDGQMLFVYVISEGTPEEGTLCSETNNILKGTVVNLKPIYDYIMSGIREIEQDCSVPQNYMNLLLQFQAVNYSIKTGNYPLAIKYWKRFFTEDKTMIINNNNCGCHGRN